jgi:hypothetical protein
MQCCHRCTQALILQRLDGRVASLGGAVPTSLQVRVQLLPLLITVAAIILIKQQLILAVITTLWLLICPCTLLQLCYPATGGLWLLAT